MSNGKKKQTRKTPPPPVSHEAFVKAWMSHSTIDEVAETTGLSYSGVTERAKRLRDAGVQLPGKSRRMRQDIDVKSLNSMILR